MAVASSPSKTYPLLQQLCTSHFSKLNHIRGIKLVHARNLKSSLGFAKANFWRKFSPSLEEGEKFTYKIPGLARQLRVLTSPVAYATLHIVYKRFTTVFYA